MAKDKNTGGTPTPTKPKKVTTTKNPFVATAEERKRYGVSGTGGLDARTLQAIKDDREAEAIANAWNLPSSNPPAAGGGAGGAGSGRGGAGASGGGSISKLLAEYVRRSMGNINSDLSAQETQINTLGQQAKTRYDDYLAKLTSAQTTAQGNINAARDALLASIPQTATANPVMFQQPSAATNAYSDYLRSMGMASPEVAGLQNFTSANATAANQMAQNAALAQQAAQQQYLDNLRSTAGMAATAANQRLAGQLPQMQMQALARYGQTQGDVADLLAKARTGAATTRQNTLDALLPLLIQYPQARNAVLRQFRGA